MGGDRMSLLLSPISGVAGKAVPTTQPISPQEGEMPGRAEGGAKDRDLSWKTHPDPQKGATACPRKPNPPNRRRRSCRRARPSRCASAARSVMISR
ncbi:MAG: hypothetical protein EOS30_11665 [Mesorhizobium sp.]|nr:hypothetical protein EN746_01955 [Mesorhizobium sp. M8A.F.Ca.ET.023.02.2.1]RWC74899.1 MAG: hypothetical protein EOS30_11665 [Mesorhizobium sp.]